MAAQFARAPHRGVTAGPTTSAPNAALLIDFDNVTMGIRSDLSKELKHLLNSDIIKGKVAVQRAYADWRRYPQYIVPLAEASVDLIFAPAYGSSKKNATDIRLAIDALELVFTRPEIGTFILLSGDSDFSSLVLKLKEYGKYVIGVGIRESASDLLVQNCDEYYSYSVLSGLTKEGEEVGERPDPWTLVKDSVRQMAEQADVMRSDRLKQVMLELDPNFNEKDLGYSKFSKFLSDAVARGCLSLRKLENGQWEVAPVANAEVEAQAPASPKPDGERESRGSREDGRRSRGRGRDRASGRREEVSATDEARGKAAPESRAEAVAADESDSEQEIRPTADAAAAASVEAKPDRPVGDPLAAAYELLQRATAEAAGGAGGVARDSDVKRRMLELEPGWDESTLGFSKFSRFLRQAHDAEVIDLHKTGNGTYEVRVGSARAATVATEPRGRREAKGAESPAEGRRGRSERSEAAKAAARAPVEHPVADPKATEPEKPKVAAAEEPKAEAGAVQPAEAAKVEAAPASQKSEAVDQEAAAEARADSGRGAERRRLGLGIGFRRGTVGRVTLSGPPPLLPGQAVRLSSNGKAEPAKARAQEQAAPIAEEAASAVAPAAEKPAESKSRRTKSRSKKAAEPTSAGAAAGAGKPAESKAKAANAAKGDMPELAGLPTQAEEVIAYLSTRYKGVGRKTAEALVEAFGAGGVFRVLLHEEADRLREVVGERRAATVMSAWHADLEQRRAEAAALVAEAAPAPADAKPDQVEAGKSTEPIAAQAAAEAKASAERGRSGARKGRGAARKAAAKAKASAAPAEGATQESEPMAEASPMAEADAPAAGAAEASDAPGAGAAGEEAGQKKASARSRGRRGGRKRSKPKVSAGDS